MTAYKMRTRGAGNRYDSSKTLTSAGCASFSEEKTLEKKSIHIISKEQALSFTSTP